LFINTISDSINSSALRFVFIISKTHTKYTHTQSISIAEKQQKKTKYFNSYYLQGYIDRKLKIEIR